MIKTAEVIIIGGGVIGCSIAYHIAKLGCHDIIVLERDFIGSGSTSKCPGGIRQQFSTEVNVKLSMESVRFFERFESETGFSADFRQYGYLMLATNEAELELFRQNVALQQKLGLKVYLFSAQEAKEMMPQLTTEDITGATYCPTDGFADPHSVVHGFAAAARRLGVEIREETLVTGIKLAGSRVRGVLTTKGEYETPVVVNAAGAYAAQVGQMTGLAIPVSPYRRHIFVSAPLEEIPKKSPMVVDFHTGFWFRREGASLIFGMRNPTEPASFDSTVDWGFLATLAETVCHRVPLLSNMGVMHAQAGLHADTPDYSAIIGHAPDIEGLYLACGFSGHGFMHSPAVGQGVAELILGAEASLSNMSSLYLDRFEEHAYHREESMI